MVGIPALPGSTPPPVSKPEGGIKVTEVVDLIEVLPRKQREQLYLWALSRPPEDGKVVSRAQAAFDALEETELPEFFQAMRESLSPDIWDLLTE